MGSEMCIRDSLFGNKTLDEIAERVPGDRNALLKCRGIGHTKLEDFGDAVLAVIAEHGSGAVKR